MLTVIALAGLTWSRSDRGQAALLHLGADALFGTVQARLDSVLVTTSADHVAGPVGPDSPADAHDWPLPDGAPGDAVRCRVLPVASQAAWWQIQADLARAVGEVGGRVLWGERLPRPGDRRTSVRPDERRDLLRLDLGVPGHATHTLVLYRVGESRPEVRWGGDPAATAWRQLQARAEAPRLAIVIDDWGYRRDATTDALLDLAVPLTLAVLPNLAYSRGFALKGTDLALPSAPAGDPAHAEADVARRRLAAGTPVTLGLGRDRGRLASRRREVMLHLPMESVRYPEIDPGQAAIMVGMARAEMAEILDAALAALPNVRGINNHQGSAATADRATMDDLMALLRERDLFFLDSLTSSGSVAHQAALDAGVPTLRNRIFLDDDHENQATIRERLRTAVRSARAGGAAVAIGHPHPATLAVLAAELPRLAAEGVCLVTISELLALETGRTKAQ